MGRRWRFWPTQRVGLTILDSAFGNRLLVGFRQGMLFGALKSEVWRPLGLERGRSQVTGVPALEQLPHFN